MTSLIDDYSADFARRGAIIDRQGVALSDFTKTLKPRFAIVYRDIALGYAAIIGAVGLSIVAVRVGTPFWIVSPFVGVVVGYWVAYLMLFIHEGAHWNLAADQDRSDLIGNLLVGWWIGTTVADYRRVHFEHHRSLGATHDSEHSYFFPINVAFVAKILFGVRVLEVIVSRATKTASAEAPEAAPTPAVRSLLANPQLLFCAGIHGAVGVGLVATGFWSVALGWGLAMGVVFPFFGALRQMLEHRSSTADPEVDYTMVDHGAVARVFGDDWLSRTFGGAGFNRHLLHHWQPKVSYTRLKTLERFLLETDLHRVIEARRTTYLRTLVELVRANRRFKAPADAGAYPAP